MVLKSHKDNAPKVEQIPVFINVHYPAYNAGSLSLSQPSPEFIKVPLSLLASGHMLAVSARICAKTVC